MSFRRLAGFGKLIRAAGATVVMLLASHCMAQLPAGWLGTDIGGAATGSDTYSSGTYTISGAGTGFGNGNVTFKSDQMHFTYTQISGDFKLIARVASFSGTKGSEVGLAIRADATSGTSSSGAVLYQPAMGSGTNPNAFYMYNRNAQSGAYWPWDITSAASQIATPCWLQLVRSGQDFAVYKSNNGTEWAQVHNTSGGAFTVSGTVCVGFFVASGTTATATAQIDNVSLTTTSLTSYESSWIGNTFSKDSTSYISGYGRSIWVAPDGTCYMAGTADEAGQPGKVYKSGTVVKALQLSCQNSYEGSITSDGTSLFYWGAYNPGHSMFYQTNMNGSASTALPIYCQTSLANPSGIACGNGELYISDINTNQVLVAGTARNDCGLGGNQLNKCVTSTIDVSGVSNPAPQGVYQTEFIGVPSLNIPIASGTYTVRMHFAELDSGSNVIPGYRIMNLTAGNQTVNNYDILAVTGTNLKAAVVSMSNVVVTTGTLAARALWKGGTASPAWGILSGVEILDAAGVTQIKAVNAGGGATGSWLSTINEISSRAFAFTRPGPIAVDKRGNLWIIQEGVPYPAGNQYVTASGSAAIKCYDKNGTQLTDSLGNSIQMTDFVNPTAICYDSTNDRLLVAENGPDQNIRIYTGLVSGTALTTPTCSSTFGQSVFSGSTPGVVYDPAAGGDARFYGLQGVGVDGSGNIYVSCNWSACATDLKVFTPSGSLLWKVQGLDFCNCGDFDPTMDASDIWTPNYHYTMNYSNFTPGGEWTLKSYLWNKFQWGQQPNSVANSAVYRKINGTPIMYTAGQGLVGPVYIYRFNGEQLIPCGKISSGTAAYSMNVWVDTNGNGIQDVGEVTTYSTSTLGSSQAFDVGSDGSIYIAMGGYSNRVGAVQKFPFAGLNSYGCPIYNSTTSLQVPASARFGGGWMCSRLRYVGGVNDTMYLLGATYPLAGGTAGGLTYNYGGTLSCFNNWNSSPQLQFSTVLPNPGNDLNLTYGVGTYGPVAPFIYNSFDVANGTAFVSQVWGPIEVVNSAGAILSPVLPGPEIDGGCGFSDDCMGTRAHYNAGTGEYYICQENSGYQAKQNFYRLGNVTEWLYTDFQDGINPFVATSSTTGGSTSVVQNVPYAGDKAILFQDSSVNGENQTSTFTWTLTGTNPLVQRINQVLSGTIPATFSFGYCVQRTLASSGPVFSGIGASIQASPNDGNPPTNGLGRDRFWTGVPKFGTLSQYQGSQYIQVDSTTYPEGYTSSYPWRGYRFTVTPDGTGRTISSLAIQFDIRVNSNATPEAYIVNNIFIDEIK